jgi:hypothetical protein
VSEIFDTFGRLGQDYLHPAADQSRYTMFFIVSLIALVLAIVIAAIFRFSGKKLHEEAIEEMHLFLC